ncbi:MAG: LysR family transcriptional regulator [Sporolactobacillus sp.]
MGVRFTDIKHLHYFLEVARCKSFTKAARELYVSQPTISKMVRGIEDELGMILLDRSAKEMELTDAGQIVYQQAEQIVSSFDHLSNALEKLKATGHGKLMLGLPPMVGVYFFSELIRDFKRKYPNIDLHIVENGAKKVADLVADGKVDVGVTLEPYNHDQMDGFTFHSEPFSVLLPRNHSLSLNETLRLTDLKDEDFILFPEEFGMHSMLIINCQRNGFQPRVVVQSSQRDLMARLVANGMGITVLPVSIANQITLSNVVSIPLNNRDFMWRLSMIWRKNHYLAFATRNWIKEAKVCLSTKIKH